MRWLLLILCFLIPAPAIALAGGDARFGFTVGQPAITDNASVTCNNQSTARYGFTMGQPAIVYDATATCTAAVVATAVEYFVVIVD